MTFFAVEDNTNKENIETDLEVLYWGFRQRKGDVGEVCGSPRQCMSLVRCFVTSLMHMHTVYRQLLCNK